MVGVWDEIISEGMGSLLGIRLNGLCNENGQSSRIATIPQSAQEIHLGMWGKSNRTSITPRISQPAVMLMLSTFKNMTSMRYPSFLKASIIFCISSASCAVSSLREIKAAINAGSEP